MAALIVAISPLWGLLLASGALALTALHLVRRIGRLSWMIAALCISVAAILLGVGYAVTMMSVSNEVGIDGGRSGELPGDTLP